jgi:hypothetical protein
MRFLVLFTFILATAAPGAAQTPSGMAAMQYYVGTWACMAAGDPDSKATATYAIENGVMRDWVVVPPQGKMTEPYQLAIVTTFDAKNNRYVQTSLDNQATWAVSSAKAFTGNTEIWTASSAMSTSSAPTRRPLTSPGIRQCRRPSPTTR